MACLKRALLLLLFLLPSAQSQARQNYAQELAGINEKLTKAWLQSDAVALSSFYADSAVSMPEFHTALYGKQAIGAYLEQWLSAARVTSCDRRTVDVTRAGDYLLETGTFRRNFSLDTKMVDYDAKYLAVWRIKPSGGLELVSEITGSVKPLDRTDLPLSQLQLPDSAQVPKPPGDAKLKTVQHLNDQIASLVVKSKGAAFAPYYTQDAIYMPYYMPILVGKPAIDAYYREHEDPKTGIDAVWIKPSRIIDSGGFLLVDGYYRVDWRSGNAHGTVTGKNVSAWKRQADGRLLLSRQMAVHD